VEELQYRSLKTIRRVRVSHTNSVLVGTTLSYFVRLVFRHGVFFSREKPPINADRRSRNNYKPSPLSHCSRKLVRLRPCVQFVRIKRFEQLPILLYLHVLLSRGSSSPSPSWFFETFWFFESAAAENPLRNTRCKKYIIPSIWKPVRRSARHARRRRRLSESLQVTIPRYTTNANIIIIMTRAYYL